MKWIGQNITDIIARFGSDVYLTGAANPGTDTDRFLVVDTNGKVGIRSGSDVLSDIGAGTGSGDITDVRFVSDSGTITDSAGSADFNIVGGEGIDTSATGSTLTIAAEVSDAENLGVASFNETDFSVDAGAVSLVDLTTSHVAAGSLVVESELLTDNDNDTTWPTTGAIINYVSQNKLRIYGSTIKILPTDFMANEDAGATKTLQFDDTPATGIKPGAATTELLAIIDIPEGMKATHVDVYGAQNRAIEVFEMDINASGVTSKGSGTANTTLDITDVNATATNFLMVVVTTTATSDRVWGGKVTIAPQ